MSATEAQRPRRRRRRRSPPRAVPIGLAIADVSPLPEIRPAPAATGGALLVPAGPPPAEPPGDTAASSGPAARAKPAVRRRRRAGRTGQRADTGVVSPAAPGPSAAASGTAASRLDIVQDSASARPVTAAEAPARGVGAASDVTPAPRAVVVGTRTAGGAASDVTPAPRAAVARTSAPGGGVAREAAPAGPGAETGGEEAWERTHLEQTMFELAREHAAEAEGCIRRVPPDRQEERTHSLVAVLMSYFALEAFISMVGADRLGGRYRHYDRMTPEGKWIEVTRLASKTGNTFIEDGKELRALSTLRTWRNMLTHYKGEYEEVEHSNRGGQTRTEALLSAENAARAVEIARTMYRAFYDFDRRSPPRQLIWLNDRPRRQARPAANGSAAQAHAGAASRPVGGGGARLGAPAPRPEAPVTSGAAAPGTAGDTVSGAGESGPPPRRRRGRRRRR